MLKNVLLEFLVRVRFPRMHSMAKSSSMIHLRPPPKRGAIACMAREMDWTWRRSSSLVSALPGGEPGTDVLRQGGDNTWAPDVIHIGDQYFVFCSAPGIQPKSILATTGKMEAGVFSFPSGARHLSRHLVS